MTDSDIMFIPGVTFMYQSCYTVLLAARHKHKSECNGSGAAIQRLVPSIHLLHLFGSADVPLLHSMHSMQVVTGAAITAAAFAEGASALTQQKTQQISASSKVWKFPHLHDVKVRMQWPLPVSETSMLISSVCVPISCSLA